MSDNWPTAFIEITVNNGLLPPGEDQSRNLEMAIKQLVPHLHEKTIGQCRLMLRNVSFSDCCVADVTRFTPKAHVSPYDDGSSPHEAVIVNIVAPRKERSYGLSPSDVQNIADAIKDLLQKDPYKIDRKNVIVIPSLSDISLQQKANK